MQAGRRKKNKLNSLTSLYRRARPKMQDFWFILLFFSFDESLGKRSARILSLSPFFKKKSVPPPVAPFPNYESATMHHNSSFSFSYYIEGKVKLVPFCPRAAFFHTWNENKTLCWWRHSTTAEKRKSKLEKTSLTIGFKGHFFFQLVVERYLLFLYSLPSLLSGVEAISR